MVNSKAATTITNLLLSTFIVTLLLSAIMMGKVHSFVPPASSSYNRHHNYHTATATTTSDDDANGINIPKVVGIAGATGRTGQLVIKELLNRGYCDEIRAIVRNTTKASSVLPTDETNVNIIECDFTDEDDLYNACVGCDAVIWCATGFADTKPTTTTSDNDNSHETTGIVSKVLNFFGFGGEKVSETTENQEEEESQEEEEIPKKSIDDIGLPAIARVFANSTTTTTSTSTPKIIMLSSAGVTRPSWDDEKKQILKGCADIPIVRLNPFNILNIKAASEETLRQSGIEYCIVRPCGLNDDWPSNLRPVISQGDVAVGRINRIDVASMLCDVLCMKEACGKTFEVVTINGYTKSGTTEPIESTISKLYVDKDGPISNDAVTTSYNIMQQLLPGEKQDAAALAMGQTYEQLDKDETGRFGKRGEEKVEGATRTESATATAA